MHIPDMAIVSTVITSVTLVSWSYMYNHISKPFCLLHDHTVHNFEISFIQKCKSKYQFKLTFTFFVLFCAVCVSCSLGLMRMISSIKLLLLRSVKEENIRTSFYWPLEDHPVIAGEDDYSNSSCGI